MALFQDNLGQLLLASKQLWASMKQDMIADSGSAVPLANHLHGYTSLHIMSACYHQTFLQSMLVQLPYQQCQCCEGSHF